EKRRLFRDLKRRFTSRETSPHDDAQIVYDTNNFDILVSGNSLRLRLVVGEEGEIAQQSQWRLSAWRRSDESANVMIWRTMVERAGPRYDVARGDNHGFAVFARNSASKVARRISSELREVLSIHDQLEPKFVVFTSRSRTLLSLSWLTQLRNNFLLRGNEEECGVDFSEVYGVLFKDKCMPSFPPSYEELKALPGSGDEVRVLRENCTGETTGQGLETFDIFRWLEIEIHDDTRRRNDTTGTFLDFSQSFAAAYELKSNPATSKFCKIAILTGQLPEGRCR
ncbi:MAG: hypothetical protein AAF394_08720, partial [Planctomycetota bacterium]